MTTGADAIARRLAAEPITAGVLAALTAVSADRLSDAGKIDALVGLQRLHAWAEAREMQIMAALAAGDPATDRELARDLAATEIGVALRQPPTTVHARLRLSEQLTQRLGPTLAALQSGAITARHAAALAEAVTVLPDALAVTVEKQVLGNAGRQSVAAFRAAVHKAVLAVDPRTAGQRHKAALADRRVCGRAIGDGMGELWALLPLDGMATVLRSLDSAAAAGRQPGDERTTDQRRADALVDLAAAALYDPARPLEQGRRPAVQVTIAASTLLGVDDQPGELDGYGPIDAAMARALAFDPTGTWRRLLVDDTGRLLDIARSTTAPAQPVSGTGDDSRAARSRIHSQVAPPRRLTVRDGTGNSTDSGNLADSGRYRPGRALTDHVIARDRTCRFPGCRRAARRCDLDHVVPWPAGATSADNLQCLCEHHHRLKHTGGWSVRGNPDDMLTWTSPTGHTYRSPPGRYADAA
jgi:Domain of unknown function (DUF222)